MSAIGYRLYTNARARKSEGDHGDQVGIVMTEQGGVNGRQVGTALSHGVHSI
jgi:hypothetical protein